MSLTSINISPILKEMGLKGWDRKALVQNHPFMTQIERDTSSIVGDYFKIPVEYAKPAGRSHDAAVAYDNEAGSKKIAFKVTPITDYLTFRIDGIVVRKAMEADNDNSFGDAVKQEVMLAIEGMGDNVAKELQGSLGGARAQVHPTTAISTTSLKLANPADAVFFYPNMVVQASDTNGTSGSLRDSGDSVVLASVDPMTGILIATTNWSGISGITNNDYLFAKGDFGAAMAGLDSWNPAINPDSTPFYQVDRSVAPTFLGGMRYDGTNDSMETVFIKADMYMRIQQGNPFKDADIYINPMSLGSLRISKEGSRFIDDDNEYGIGIKKFTSPSGHTIVEDRDVPTGIGRVVGKGAFKHCTTGDQPALAEAAMANGFALNYANREDKYTATVAIDHNGAAPKPQGLMRIILPTS